MAGQNTRARSAVIDHGFGLELIGQLGIIRSASFSFLALLILRCHLFQSGDRVRREIGVNLSVASGFTI